MKSSKEGNSIRFLITKDEEGWHAQAEGISIFTEGDTLEELKENIKKAVKAHLADGEYRKYGLSSETPKIISSFIHMKSPSFKAPVPVEIFPYREDAGRGQPIYKESYKGRHSSGKQRGVK